MDRLKIDHTINLQNSGQKARTGETIMKTKDGDTVKNLLNGKYYKVKKIMKSMVVLQSEDGQSQILTEAENLSIFYKKKENLKV